ncbi:hypothetical protein JTB14_037185 [Gonioctena quinquepunctata]|nr:hypothetical protein JTB14_037185 [Gonioctena quinquepunctata]
MLSSDIIKMAETDNWTEGNETNLKKSLDLYGRTEKQLDEDVRTIKEWLKTQPHLPDISNDIYIINILIQTKFSIEISKQRIDILCTIRTLLPEIHERSGFNSLMEVSNVLYFFPLRKKTQEGQVINILKSLDCNPDQINPYPCIAYCLKTFEWRMQGDICCPEILIGDLQNTKLANVVKFTPVHLKKILMHEKSFSNTLKQIHFINCPSYAFNILNILKSLMKPKLASRVFIHADDSIMKKLVPLEALPRDYGGSELSLSELNELWKERVGKYKDRFNILAKMKTNEKLRSAALISDDILGIHGHFRKLELD